jgi:hypothetical protein
MGFIVGTLKFVIGVVLGAATGATVATLIVTRNGNETVARLRSVVEDMAAGARQAAQEEETRMNNRYQELIGDEAKQRQLKASAERAKKKAEKSQNK